MSGRAVGEALAAIVILTAIACGFAYCVAGCALFGNADTRQDMTEAAYTAELLRCVDRAQTLAESKVCRRAVDEKWHITEVVAAMKDAGGQ